jgi:DNA-binding transcriptional regulator YdaS (Cro superfamily)
MKKVKNWKEIHSAFVTIDRYALAKVLGTSYATITQIANGFRQVSPKRALQIEKVSGIKKEVLRPDIWK